MASRASRRQSHTGPSIVSLNWGPWGEVGMAREGTIAHAAALRDGEFPLKVSKRGHAQNNKAHKDAYA